MTEKRVPWAVGQRLRANAVGSRVHFRRRGAYVEGVIERTGPEPVRRVQVRVGERAYWFSRFDRGGQEVWLTGSRGRSRTQLHPGTHAEWLKHYEEVMGEPYPSGL